MYTFLVDETNKNFESGHFFIVGGLVVRPDQVGSVDDSVRKHAATAGFRSGDRFKFDTNSRPDYVTPEAHTAAKSNVIADLRSIGVRMVTAVVLHDIAKNQKYNKQMNLSLNTITGAYHNLLVTEDASGIVIIDRDNERYDHLASLYQTGLSYTTGGVKNVNDRIRMFGMTTHNASNLCAANDISLGAFRYCVNTATGSGRDDVARKIMADLGFLFWRGKDSAGKDSLRGYGFNPQPVVVNHQPYQLQYESLIDKLTSYCS
jgi:hypothetical protein